MLLTNHVLSGALIGALTRRPLPAFAAGVTSHFVLDAVPHWGNWGSRRRFLRVAGPTGWSAWPWRAPSPRRRRPLAGWPCWPGWPGRPCPTSTSPSKLWFGRSPFPAAVDRFHMRIQDEAAHRFYVELLTAAALASAALIALRTRRSRRLSR